MSIERFLKDIADHQLSVELDQGVFRSLGFQRHDSGIYAFRITTWPGSLAISGNMGCFVFSRMKDMFCFFRSDKLSINPHYWHEKLDAECITDGATRFDVGSFNTFLGDSAFEGYITEEQAEEMENVPGNEHEAYNLIAEANSDLLDDPPDLTGYTPRYIWVCHAIVWGIQQYDAQKVEGGAA